MGLKNKNIASKLILILTAALVICLNLVGCGHKNNPTAVNEEEEKEEKEEEFFSVPLPEDEKEIRYYFKYIIQRETFELSLFVPEDYRDDVTDFELWADNEQVGERTPVDKTLRHLTLSKDKTDKVHIQLYNNTELVADCEINPDDESGTLSLETIKIEKIEIGTYRIVYNEYTGLNTLALDFSEAYSKGKNLTH